MGRLLMEQGQIVEAIPNMQIAGPYNSDLIRNQGGYTIIGFVVSGSLHGRIELQASLDQNLWFPLMIRSDPDDPLATPTQNWFDYIGVPRALYAKPAISVARHDASCGYFPLLRIAITAVTVVGNLRAVMSMM